MRLPRRQPRSVYRVYSEEDYLDGTEPLPDWEADAPVADVRSEDPRSAEVPAATPAADARVTDVASCEPPATSVPTLRRFAVGAALAGAVVLVGGAIATAVLSRGLAVRRGDVQPVVSEPSATTAQAPRAARSRVLGSPVAKRRSAHPRGPVPVRRAKARATSRSRPRSRARVASGPRRGATPVVADLGASATPQPASAVAAAPAAPVTAAAPIAAVPVAAIAPESAAAREFAPSAQLSAQVEFGFERR